MYGYQAGKQGGMNYEIGIDIYIYSIDTMYKKITNKNLLYSRGNSTQCSVVI